MKNKIVKISAVILGISTTLTAFSACSIKTDSDLTENIPSVTYNTTKAETVINKEGEVLEIATQDENYTYFKPQTTIKEEKEYTYAINDYTYNKNSNNRDSQDEGQTKAPFIDEKIDEKASGISIVAKSSSVYAGNSATIMIQGTPGKQYSIDFYESPGNKADYSDLKTQTADDSGFVSWSFIIEETCAKGPRKLYIKEKNSSNYIQTSIFVQ